MVTRFCKIFSAPCRYVPRVIGRPSSGGCSAKTMLLSGRIVTSLLSFKVPEPEAQLCLPSYGANGPVGIELDSRLLVLNAVTSLVSSRALDSADASISANPDSSVGMSGVDFRSLTCIYHRPLLSRRSRITPVRWRYNFFFWRSLMSDWRKRLCVLPSDSFETRWFLGRRCLRWFEDKTVRKSQDKPAPRINIILICSDSHLVLSATGHSCR